MSLYSDDEDDGIRPDRVRDSNASDQVSSPVASSPSRKESQEPWKSGNCVKILAMQLPNQRDIEFTSALRRPTKAEMKEGAKSDVMIEQNVENSIVGRPHQEQAALMYMKGEEAPAGSECGKCAKGNGKFAKCVTLGEMHHGSCANCVFQSDTLECKLAQASIRKEAQDRLEAKATKELVRRARGKGSSKTKKLQPPKSYYEQYEDGDAESAGALRGNAADRGGRRNRGGSGKGPVADGGVVKSPRNRKTRGAGKKR